MCDANELGVSSFSREGTYLDPSPKNLFFVYMVYVWGPSGQDGLIIYLIFGPSMPGVVRMCGWNETGTSHLAALRVSEVYVGILVTIFHLGLRSCDVDGGEREGMLSADFLILLPATNCCVI